jgi:hypothetical protein
VKLPLLLSAELSTSVEAKDKSVPAAKPALVKSTYKSNLAVLFALTVYAGAKETIASPSELNETFAETLFQFSSNQTFVLVIVLTNPCFLIVTDFKFTSSEAALKLTVPKETIPALGICVPSAKASPIETVNVPAFTSSGSSTGVHSPQAAIQAS